MFAALSLHLLNARDDPKFNPKSLGLLNDIFFKSNLLGLLDKVACLTFQPWQGTPPENLNVDQLRPLAERLLQTYDDLHYKYTRISAHRENWVSGSSS